MITVAQLAAALDCPAARAAKWVAAINLAMGRYSINTDLRMAHFIAQIGHESGRLIYVREIASGRKYEGRKDLGNTWPGDGIKFKGRGLIQITGRNNYQLLSNALGVNFVAEPALLEYKDNAAMSAAWFWDAHHLNVLADLDHVVPITKIINGGTNGLVERQSILANAKKALGI